MASIAQLTKRLSKVAAFAEKLQDAQLDEVALRLITESLLTSLAQDGSEPVEQYTPEEQKIVDKFAKKYNANTAQAELLAYLEALPDEDEEIEPE